MTREEIEKLEHEYFPEGYTEKQKREILDVVATERDTSVVILENFSYPKGLVGWLCEDGKVRAVYEPEKMIEDLLDQNEEWTYEDAIEWYDFNTVRGMPYCYTDDAPCPVLIEEAE